MKKIGFITNIDKDPELEYTKKLVDWVMKQGCIPLVTDMVAKGIEINEGLSSSTEIYENAEFVVVLGGDGTILRVARTAAKYGTPILGINLGTLGYLADVEKNDAVTAIQRVLDGQFTIEKRMMLESYIDRGCVSHDINLSLNEVCISNSVFSRMISLRVEVNGQFMNSIKADGIIVATPTGSTAYNLSAGGPILKPDTELMAITHVCPHTLYTRPFVVSGNDIVKVIIESDFNNVILSFDGQQSIPIKNGDNIVIKKSKFYTNIIKTTHLSFYDILRRKLVETHQ